MTTPDAALPSWIDDAAAIKWVAERTCVNPERDWDIDDVGEAFRAGQAHADAGLLEALEAVTDDLEAEIEARRCTVLPRTTERDLATVRAARAAIAAAKGE
jgi:hypothetical protein